MDLLLFGSPGTVVETGRLERLAFNAAFDELGLGLYWNVATYCKLTGLASGPESLTTLVGEEWATGLVEEVLECKLKHLSTYLEGGIEAREGVLDTIALCKQEGIRLGWVTDRPKEYVQLILEATNDLSGDMFDRIFTAEQLPARKPDPRVYPFVLGQFGCSTDSVVAVEDSSLNQSSALIADIQCYLFPGEYSSVEHDILLTRNLMTTVDMANRSWMCGTGETQIAPRQPPVTRRV